jgi:hypothetical protein
MSMFDRFRERFFPVDEPDWTERDRNAAKVDKNATVQAHRGIELMISWNPERAEELRRFMRTGNFAEGEIVPERRRGPQ